MKVTELIYSQMDELGGKRGLESINRINYDDVNECMTNKYLVHRTLGKLGVHGSKLKHVHDAYEKLVQLPVNEVHYHILAMLQISF